MSFVGGQSLICHSKSRALEAITKKDYVSRIVNTPAMQIAGGSGLTPMLQVIKEIDRNPTDQTQVNFIFANQSVDDIILKKELDEIAANNDNINVSPQGSVRHITDKRWHTTCPVLRGLICFLYSMLSLADRLFHVFAVFRMIRYYNSAVTRALLHRISG